MARIVNVLSWSNSRARTLHRCQRRYYLRYYLFWGGWEAEASDAARMAYVLSKMVDLPALVGDVVHKLIAANVRALKRGRFRELDPEDSLRRMREVWRDARRYWSAGPSSLGRGGPSPKEVPPVFEVFYGEEAEGERIRALAQRAPQCVAAYGGSAMLARLRRAAPEEILWVDPHGGTFDKDTQLRVDGHPVYCIPDLVWRSGDQFEIVDWKTGSPQRGDRDQVAAYALWAVEKLGADPAQLRGRLVYLGEGAREEEVSIDEFVLSCALQRIRSDLERMVGFLADPAGNRPVSMEEFARRDEESVCRRCPYRAFCWPEGLPREWEGR